MEAAESGGERDGTAAEPAVQGHCAPGFERVRRVFENNFARGLETGAGFSVFVDGEPVVELWGGLADHRTGRAWERATPCFAFSCTKALTAAAALRVARQHGLDLDGPVAAWWPGFDAHGKAGTTGADLLSHRAGLPAFDRRVSAAEAADPEAMAAQLARQAPAWEPGTRHGYHPFTYGWLAGEIVRRIDGRSVGAYVADEFAGPLGLDLWVGAPEDVLDRTARLTRSGAGGDSAASGRRGDGASGGAPSGEDPLSRMERAARDPESLFSRAFSSPDMSGVRGGFNNRSVLSAGWPAAGLTATATGLAGFYRDLLAGRILEPAALQHALSLRSEGPDEVMVLDSAFGLGFMRPSLTFPVPRAATAAFGHTGSGGSIGLADPDHGLSIGYVVNGLGAQLSGGMRSMRLVKAVYDSLRGTART
ncbi:serine hydrolase domain-containing protein [Nocardiopsis coralliicola]